MAGALKLRDGARIAVIGGGPAGAFFSHFAIKSARETGQDLSVTIFDGKDFLRQGPSGCNLCAGVIAENLNLKLCEEGIVLPEKRIINRVAGYTLHLKDKTLRLTPEDDASGGIATVFRGNGPRYSQFPDIVSFDDFLLTWAQDCGAELVREPVQGIELPRNRRFPIRLLFGKGESVSEFNADLVVGAFGLHSPLLRTAQDLGFGYKPPRVGTTAQAEFRLGFDATRDLFGDTIHVFIFNSSPIRYATITPKGDFVTVTIIGRRKASADLLREFISSDAVRGRIPFRQPHCFCFPKIARTASRRPFTDRFVIIGDASFSRHYKNGLESAFLTARLAAETAVFRGLDSRSFAVGYLKPASRRIIRDNRYGRFLFRLNDAAVSVGFLAGLPIDLAENDDDSFVANRLRHMLWHMFTGNIPYKRIFRMLVDPKLQIRLLWRTIRLPLTRVARRTVKKGGSRK